ncbi:MAG: glycosyltransferase family 4 protein [Bacteroidales bacterium]|nr:glycosyltransferase family 4 protein [Bacteroidales bacterium]
MRKHIKPENVFINPNGQLVTVDKGRERVIEVSVEEAKDEKKPAKFEFTGRYTSDIFTETGMFARIGEKIAEQHNYDVIHAHDWLTYEAGIAAKEASGKPLVVHVHATEYDRSGATPNPMVFAIEQHGMQQADAVITVSKHTRDTVIDKYGIDPDKVFAIYNGVDFKPDRRKYKKPAGEKLVTFLGRITYQKGPRYFIEAAFKVLKQLKNVRFVMAGGGDMLNQMVTAAARLGIADRFHFTDFLNHDEVRHLLAVSDIYVMPSVSEPFGIAPLEAVRSGVPVIISRQSGVAELLKHAIKVDYNDVDAIADAIHALIKFPSLSKSIVKAARNEVRSLKWQECAKQISAVYNNVCNNQKS